ncbi:4'-phosphopantetheinyl transferase superfamily protein [Flavobacterium sp.]|uniref:4'-phosphopantetheinyl transferase family protein n=1 Tax=Flavobacterium sp. TaxID=239 RepID=UPI0039E544F6
MIGNDVIDLALARKESNWKRKGYLDKIFTADEQAMIVRAENPTLMVWSLWSRKEAVYKIHNRTAHFRGFIPLKIACQADGKVLCGGQFYFTDTIVTAESIATVAVLEERQLSQICYLQDREEVVKKEGFPYRKTNSKPVSISHHGRFEQIVTLTD